MSFFSDRFTCTNVRAGFQSGMILTLVVLAFANFIFVGDLRPYLGLGFGIILFSSIPLLLTINFFSEVKGAVAYPFAIVCVFLASTLAHMNLESRVSPEELWPTTLWIIFCLTLSLSFFTAIASIFKLGNAVKYVPFPVLGGLLGAIGVLMIFKAINSLNHDQSLFNLTDFSFNQENYIQIAIALFLASILIWNQKIGLKKIYKWLFLLAFTGFIVFISMHSHFSNWFINLEYQGALWPPVQDFNFLQHINFLAVVHFIPEIISLNFVFITSLLINLNGMEAFLKKDININRELKITSIANFITGIFGGIGGCMAATQTIPNIKNGGISFCAALASSLVIIIALILGSYGFFQYIPSFLLGAIPIFLGTLFLLQWVYESRTKLTSILEWGVLFLTLFASLIFGLVYGVLTGVISASLLFIYNLSFSSPIYKIVSGKKLKSKVDRSIEEEVWLDDLYHRIVLIELQGHLFFGNSFNLLQALKTSMAQGSLDPIKYMVLDVSQVKSLDSSAVVTFKKIEELIKEKKITLCLCGMKTEVVDLLKSSFMHCFEKPDDAFEWIENNYLQNSFESNSETYFISQHLEFLSSISDKKNYKAQEIIIEQNQNSDALYIVLKGKVRAFRKNSHNDETTYRKMSTGALLGELSFFLNSKTFNSVVSDTDSEVLKISRDRIKVLKREDSEKIVKLFEIICVCLSERILKLNQNFTK